MDIQLMIARYNAAKAKKVGEVFACAFCGKEKKKIQHQQAFCCIRHKDLYHNTVDEKRKTRAMIHNGTYQNYLNRKEEYFCKDDRHIMDVDQWDD